MATTNLIADFLIIGICSLIWLIPGMTLLTDIPWVVVNDLGVAPSFAFLGAVYVLGICINRLADDLTSRGNDQLKHDVFGASDNGPSYHTRVNQIVVESESAAAYLSYRRSIIRITRACALNFLLGAVGWGIVVVVSLVRDPTPSLLIPLVAGLISGCLAWLLFRAWPVVLKGYFLSIKDMYERVIAVSK